MKTSSDQISQLSGKGKVAPVAPKVLVYLTKGKHTNFILGLLLFSTVSLQIDLRDALNRLKDSLKVPVTVRDTEMMVLAWYLSHIVTAKEKNMSCMSGSSGGIFSMCSPL